MAYCRTLGVPFGINVESVSIRRVEIEASVRLAAAATSAAHELAFDVVGDLLLDLAEARINAAAVCVQRWCGVA